MRQYRDIDRRTGDLAIIVMPKGRMISCTCHMCTAHEPQTQFTATFTRSERR